MVEGRIQDTENDKNAGWIPFIGLEKIDLRRRYDLRLYPYGELREYFNQTYDDVRKVVAETRLREDLGTEVFYKPVSAGE